MKYRKKSEVIEAVQLSWDTWNEMCDFVGVGKLVDGKAEGKKVGEEIQLIIPTFGGLITAHEGDFVIKGAQGEFYLRKSDIFEQTHERVEGDA